MAKEFEVLQGVPNVRSDANAVLVGVLQGVLEGAEEAPSPWDGKYHAPEFADDVLPALEADALFVA